MAWAWSPAGLGTPGHAPLTLSEAGPMELVGTGAAGQAGFPRISQGSHDGHAGPQTTWYL